MSPILWPQAIDFRQVRRLPYFDFQEVATARQLAELLASGISPQAIEKKLAELGRWLPDVERPLAQLSIIVEGKNLLLRQGEGLLEPGGQFRFDFDAPADAPDPVHHRSAGAADDTPIGEPAANSPEDLREAAADLSKQRHKVAKKLTEETQRQLADLGMADAKMTADLTPIELGDEPTSGEVPAWGIEAATRAFLKIIDNVNKMTKQEIAAAPIDLADPTRPVR